MTHRKTVQTCFLVLRRTVREKKLALFFPRRLAAEPETRARTPVPDSARQQSASVPRRMPPEPHTRARAPVPPGTGLYSRRHVPGPPCPQGRRHVPGPPCPQTPTAADTCQDPRARRAADTCQDLRAPRPPCPQGQCWQGSCVRTARVSPSSHTPHAQH